MYRCARKCLRTGSIQARSPFPLAFVWNTATHRKRSRMTLEPKIAFRRDAAARLHFGWGRRMPVILQTEAAECGLACLAMIASYHDHHTNLPALRQKFSVSLKGTTLARLIEIAHALGMQSRPLRLDLDGLSQLHAPCILHWDLNHFVVLKHVIGSKVVLHDPAVGERTLSFSEVSRGFTGVALELLPGPTFQPAKANPTIAFSALTGRIVGLKRALTQILGLALVLELL